MLLIVGYGDSHGIADSIGQESSQNPGAACNSGNDPSGFGYAEMEWIVTTGCYLFIGSIGCRNVRVLHRDHCIGEIPPFEPVNVVKCGDYHALGRILISQCMGKRASIQSDSHCCIGIRGCSDHLLDFPLRTNIPWIYPYLVGATLQRLDSELPVEVDIRNYRDR